MESEFLNVRQAWQTKWERFINGPAELELCVAPSSEGQAQILFESLCNDFGSLNRDRAELSLELDSYTREERRWEWLAGRVLQTRVKKKIQQNQIHSSLSHTTYEGKTYLVAVGIGMSDMTAGIFGVGIDLESSSRKISEDVFDRVTTESERVRAALAGLKPIELWVQKEAAFKATPNNEGCTITQYELMSWDAAGSVGVIHSSGLQAQCLQVHTLGIFDGPWKLALSFSAQSPQAR